MLANVAFCLVRPESLITTGFAATVDRKCESMPVGPGGVLTTRIMADGSDKGIRHPRKSQGPAGHSVDDDFDTIIFEQWQLHLAELPLEVAKSKGRQTHF